MNVAQVCFAFARQLPLLEWELGCFWMRPELHYIFVQACKFANKMAAERILHASRAAEVNNALTTSHAHDAWRKFARHPEKDSARTECAEAPGVTIVTSPSFLIVNGGSADSPVGKTVRQVWHGARNTVPVISEM